MIIGMEFNERGRRELRITPTTSMWTVEYRHTSHNWLGGNGVANTSAVEYIIRHHCEQATRTPRRSDNLPMCAKAGDRFPCPHRKVICSQQSLKKVANQRKCAMILGSDYTSYLEPVGQMSIFSPTVTHRRMWRTERIRGGYSLPPIASGTQPFVPIETACKERAVAVMEILKRCGWFGTANAWKVLPYRVDPEWQQAQQEKYAGRYRPCTFDQF